MKPIDVHTLDEWLFEYVEGNLGAAERSELEGYLTVNPGAQAELAAWQAAVVPAKPVQYPNSQALVRPAFSGGWIMGLSGLFVLALVGLLMGGWWRSPTKTAAQPLARVHGIMGQLATLNLPEPATQLTEPTPNIIPTTKKIEITGRKTAPKQAAKQLTLPAKQAKVNPRKRYTSVESIISQPIEWSSPDHPELESRVIRFYWMGLQDDTLLEKKTKPAGKSLKRVPLDSDAF